MSLVKNQCNIILPPGDSHREITEIEHSGDITIPHSFNETPPLVPHVRVTKEDHNIAIEAIVFIDSTVDRPKLIVSQLLSVSIAGEYQLQFFIHCNEDEIERLRENRSRISYKAFRVKFDTKNTAINFPEGVTLEHVKTTQTFLWNIDPETSRGTEVGVLTTT
ncbi:hypothetical protein [Tenacibaculum ovolyticum]|uniref:hypothetical protein n=1 Tax=Tenacibaculum ovolyticum TaxID=104270 RepID=UPI003BAD22F5